MAPKRARSLPLSLDDIYWYARMIMENDPWKDRAPRDEDRNFRALFGCGAEVILKLRTLLEENDLIPIGGTITHLLWTCLHGKTYSKWKTMRKLTKTDPKTLRKWIRDFLDSISQLEGLVVSKYHSLICRFGGILLILTFAFFLDRLGKAKERRHT